IFGLLLVIPIAMGCGGSAAKSASASPTAADGGPGGGRNGGGRFRGTPNAQMQTSIAEGTPFGFGNRTPPPEAQTAIAEGTPFPFGNRMAPPEVETAIAEGTPAGSLRGGPGFGGGRALMAAATVLGVDAGQLRTELPAQ